MTLHVESVPQEWIEIPGYEGAFAVSPQGVVKSLSRMVVRSDQCIRVYTSRIVKSRLDLAGYETVRLSWNRLTKTHYVHRLVATCFVPNPELKPYVNHINGQKFDNRAANLEWVTHRENIIHAYRSGLIDANKGANHHEATTVINVETGEAWNSIREAAEVNGVEYGTLRQRLKNGRWGNLVKIPPATDTRSVGFSDN